MDVYLLYLYRYLRDCPNVRSTFYLHKYTLDDRWMERRVLSICSSIIQETTIPIGAPEVADMFGSNHRSLFRYFSHLQVDGHFSDVTTCRSLLIMLSIFENLIHVSQLERNQNSMQFCKCSSHHQFATFHTCSKEKLVF